MTTLPTDDLRARLLNLLRSVSEKRINKEAASECLGFIVQHGDAIAAAISALPAGGEQPFRNMPDGTTFEQYRDALAVGGLTPVDQMAFDNLLDDLLTTPPADADVGAQGEGPGEEDGPWAAGWPERSCPTPDPFAGAERVGHDGQGNLVYLTPAVPAAGKGVDDDVREYLTEKLAAEGEFEGLGYSKVERNLRALRKLSALTRQPVAGDKK